MVVSLNISFEVATATADAAAAQENQGRPPHRGLGLVLVLPLSPVRGNYDQLTETLTYPTHPPHANEASPSRRSHCLPARTHFRGAAELPGCKTLRVELIKIACQSNWQGAMAALVPLFGKRH